MNQIVSLQPVNFAAKFYQNIDVDNFSSTAASFLYAAWICAQAEPLLNCYCKSSFENSSRLFSNEFSGTTITQGPRSPESIQSTINELQLNCIQLIQLHKDNKMAQDQLINKLIPGFMCGLMGASLGCRNIDQRYVKLYVRFQPV